jgi:hypothetical protein
MEKLQINPAFYELMGGTVGIFIGIIGLLWMAVLFVLPFVVWSINTEVSRANNLLREQLKLAEEANKLLRLIISKR